MYANEWRETKSNPICKTKHICIKHKYYSPLSKKDKYFSPLSKENMHISQILLPLFVNHQQRGESKNTTNKFSPPFWS